MSSLFQTTRATGPTIPRTGLLVCTLKPYAMLPQIPLAAGNRPKWRPEPSVIVYQCQHLPVSTSIKLEIKAGKGLSRDSSSTFHCQSKAPPMPSLCHMIDPKKKLAPMDAGTPTSRNSKYFTCWGGQSISAITGSSSHPCSERPSFAHAGLLLQRSNGTQLRRGCCLETNSHDWVASIPMKEITRSW